MQEGTLSDRIAGFSINCTNMSFAELLVPVKCSELADAQIAPAQLT